nr:DNA phosphorothioation-associated putative methyltransferase [Natronocella acetinitrilica]
MDEAGYRVTEHKLECIDTQRAQKVNGEYGVLRHRTAINRGDFSAPMQALARHDFLDGSRAVFDYGCGRGDDLRILQTNDIPAGGWDPHYRPNSPKTSAPIVNLGFVINVIENPQEREDVLRDAFELADELLVVSAMLISQLEVNRRPYSDGVISRRGTFQRYYSQEELRQLLSTTLHIDPVAVGPGIFFVFKEHSGLHAFLERRLTKRRTLITRRALHPIPRVSREERTRAFYEAHRDTLDALWQQYLALGRRPRPAEVQDNESVESLFGSTRRALNFLERYHGMEPVLAATHARTDDLRIALAMELFTGRTAAREAASRWLYGTKTSFGSKDNALKSAQALLFSIGQPEIIRSQCERAHTDGLGYIHDDGRAFTFHPSVLNQLPAELRTYVGCATYLYGDPASADLIKVHTQSAKLTMMHFDDFDGSPLPRMLERIKLNFRHQTIDVFRYGEDHVPPYLYLKSRYIPPDFRYHDEQIDFDEKLLQLGDLDFGGYGPPNHLFESYIRRHRVEVSGFHLVPSTDIPHLDEECGRYHTFRSFIECGETQQRIAIPNAPKQPDSYNALHRLATQIIDPVMDYFGGLDLTFGFCSHHLARAISNRIDPKRDQHSSYELNSRGNLICPRAGAAVDFLIPYEDMLEVAQWIAINTPFDRLYFYGSSYPIHVSIGPRDDRQIVTLQTLPNGKRIPRVISLDKLLNATSIHTTSK